MTSSVCARRSLGYTRRRLPARARSTLLLLACLAAPSAIARAEGSDAREAIARALQFTVTIEGGDTYGSGILVDPAQGLVLTAWHVVEEMQSPTVTFADGATTAGKVVESDRVLDLALVKIAPQPERPVPAVGDALALRPGDELYAVGCPRHLAFTVSRGIVSFVGRKMDGVRWLQSDLPINDGNSGGPVVNARGELVGVMSFILRRGQGLSFALPINYSVDKWQCLAALVRDPSYRERFRSWCK